MKHSVVPEITARESALPRRRGLRRIALILVCGASCVPRAMAADATVAVATNFSEVANVLRRDFEGSVNHLLTLTAGSTGKLYAQIVNGAPFDAFLAADRARPALLESSGKGVKGTRFVYAQGRLALWSADADSIGRDGSRALREGRFTRLAIANPALAPYGLAARQTLRALGLWEALQDRIVMGENIGQTFALVATKNADIGLVALSSVVSPRNRRRGSYWIVPADLHAAIDQQAILLVAGANNEAAIAFLAYLKTDAARSIVSSYGYGRE